MPSSSNSRRDEVTAPCPASPARPPFGGALSEREAFPPDSWKDLVGSRTAPLRLVRLACGHRLHLHRYFPPNPAAAAAAATVHLLLLIAWQRNPLGVLRQYNFTLRPKLAFRFAYFLCGTEETQLHAMAEDPRNGVARAARQSGPIIGLISGSIPATDDPQPGRLPKGALAILRGPCRPSDSTDDSEIPPAEM